jgi:DNA-directed RNA polymerase specialized sigma subunit
MVLGRKPKFLKEHVKKAYELRVGQNMTFSKIGDALGCSAGHASSLVSKAPLMLGVPPATKSKRGRRKGFVEDNTIKNVRRAYELRYQEGLTYREIAAEMGCTFQNVSLLIKKIPVLLDVSLPVESPSEETRRRQHMVSAIEKNAAEQELMRKKKLRERRYRLCYEMYMANEIGLEEIAKKLDYSRGSVIYETAKRYAKKHNLLFKLRTKQHTDNGSRSYAMHITGKYSWKEIADALGYASASSASASSIRYVKKRGLS